MGRRKLTTEEKVANQRAKVAPEDLEEFDRKQSEKFAKKQGYKNAEEMFAALTAAQQRNIQYTESSIAVITKTTITKKKRRLGSSKRNTKSAFEKEEEKNKSPSIKDYTGNTCA